MDREKFVEEQTVNSELAKSAWEQADGDPEAAEELLAPATLWLKGRFMAAGRSGLWLLNWDCDSETIVRLKAVVIGAQEAGTSPRLAPSHFEKQLDNLRRSSDQLEKPADKLSSALEEEWEDPESAVGRALGEEDYDRLPALHRTLVENHLELELNENEVNCSLERNIEQLEEDAEEAEPDEEEEIILPCDVSINPVKGVEVQELNKGDKILARLADVPSKLKNKPEVKEALRKVKSARDEESKLFPVKLLSGKKTESRNIVLTFQLTPDVKGQAKCGKEVGLLAPEETVEKVKAAGGSSGKITKWIKSYGTQLFLGIIFIVLAVAGWLYLF